jgi:esterase/lipase superfamily enzyme
VKTQAQVSQVHVIAHSMGNWMVANALQKRLQNGGPSGKEQLLNQLVLAAPDISARGFREQFLKTLPQLARRVTLYLSDNDKALKASAKFRTGNPRAGELKGGVMNDSEPRFDAVDATSLTTDFLDHSYYADNRSMLADIYCLLRGSDAKERPLIESAGVNWRFRAMRASLKADDCPPAETGAPTIALPRPIRTLPSDPGFLRSNWRWLTAGIALLAIVSMFAARRRRAT